MNSLKNWEPSKNFGEFDFSSPFFPEIEEQKLPKSLKFSPVSHNFSKIINDWLNDGKNSD